MRALTWLPSLGKHLAVKPCNCIAAPTMPDRRDMSSGSITFTGPLRIWPGDKGSWTFLSITGDAAEAIAAHALMERLELGRRRGFGSVKITLHIGDSTASTSVFPMQGGSWFLPVKKAIRRAEGIEEGDTITAELELL
jgi:hypothetical protein